MKKKIILLILLGVTIKSIAQTTRSFTKDFRTSSGIYGSVEVLVRTATYGFASVQVQQKRTIVKGINSYNGNDLAAHGMSFPFECSNCYFYVSGDVGLGSDNASFSSAGSVHKSSYTIHTANFSQEVKDSHNEGVKTQGYSSWERYGFITNVNVSGVAGGDLGRVRRAVEALKRAEREAENKRIRKKREKEAKERKKVKHQLVVRAQVLVLIKKTKMMMKMMKKMMRIKKRQLAQHLQKEFLHQKREEKRKRKSKNSRNYYWKYGPNRSNK